MSTATFARHRALRSPLSRYQGSKASHKHVIFVDESVGAAIRLFVQGMQPERPLTHDLIANILQALGTKIESVIINDRQGKRHSAGVGIHRAGKLPEGTELRFSNHGEKKCQSRGNGLSLLPSEQRPNSWIRGQIAALFNSVGSIVSATLF